MKIIKSSDTATAATTTAPYKIDPFRGSSNSAVSMQWMSRPSDQRFLSLDELYDYKRKFWDQSFETRTITREVDFLTPEIKTAEDMHKLRLGISYDACDSVKTKEIAPTHWAFGQLSGLAKSPAGFLRELPSPMVADILNWRLRHAREIEEIKLYGGDDELYSATGPDYGRIPDYQVVDAVRQIAGSGRGEMRWKIPGQIDWRTKMYHPDAPVTKESTTLFASDRDCFIFLVDDHNPIEVGKLDDGSPDLMFRGFYLQNSEMGSRSLKLAAFYLRGICMNRTLWGVENFEEITIRHTRMAPDRWLQQARPALQRFANGSTERLIAGVEAAKSTKVAKDDEAAIEFLTQRKFSAAKASAILDAGEKVDGHRARNVWDIANAITAHARDIPNTDDRISQELVAKAILDKVA